MALDQSRVQLAFEQALKDPELARAMATQLLSQGAALTAQLTTITHEAASEADYAIAALTDTGGFGFAAADEGHTVLAVIANLQTRLAEVEARLEAAGIVAAN